jgi:outer membrane receptor protein involved in Fe transport
MYASFDPVKRINADDRSQSYRIPSSLTVDLHIHYSFNISDLPATLFFTCNNLFDTQYIERGDDGATHDLSSFRGFWNFGRNILTGIRIRF